jgi:hypothetical protein
MKYPLKLIEWEDAFNGDHDWFPLDAIGTVEPCLTLTVGFEVARDEHRVTLMMSHNQYHGCDLFTIPLGMIRREKILRSRM